MLKGGGSTMLRIAITAFSLLVGAMVLTQTALGQTTTPTPSTTTTPTPSTTVPTSAPATGFGY